MTVNVPVNDEYAAMFNTDARYYYNIGGRWSAKTWETLSENITEALTYPNLRITVARKVYDSMRNSIYEDMLSVIKSYNLQETIHYTTTRNPLYIKFSNGSDVIFKGADRPDKLKGIANSHRLIMEELNEFSQDDFEALDLSMRGTKYPLKTYMMHNPVPHIPGRKFWFQEQFDCGKLKAGKPVVYTMPGLGRVAALKTTYQHNKFCPQNVIDRLEGFKITNPLKYELWAKGDYAALEGVILTEWDIVDNVPDNTNFMGYGLDFGFSQDPAACVGVWRREDELWVKGILYLTGLGNSELYKLLIERGLTKYDKIIADSAEPKSIYDLFNYGFKGIKGAKKRANYKAEMANVLKSFKIHLISGDIDLQREVSTWAWQKDKNGKDLPRPADGDDHYMDAMIMLLHEYKGSDKMSVAEYDLGDLGL